MRQDLILDYRLLKRVEHIDETLKHLLKIRGKEL